MSATKSFSTNAPDCARTENVPREMNSPDCARAVNPCSLIVPLVAMSALKALSMKAPDWAIVLKVEEMKAPDCARVAKADSLKAHSVNAPDCASVAKVDWANAPD